MESQIRFVGVVSLAIVIGCRAEIPAARSSVDSQASVVATTSTTDPQSVTLPTTSSSPPALAPSSSPDTAPSVADLSPRDSLCGDMGENGLRIPNARRKAVAAQFGRADSVRSKPAPNTHDPAQMDTVVDVFYPDLVLHYAVLGRSGGDTDILMEADIANNRYLKYPALGVGASLEDIIRALGEPHERTNNTISYTCALHIMSGARVTFHLASGRVTMVEYYYDTD